MQGRISHFLALSCYIIFTNYSTNLSVYKCMSVILTEEEPEPGVQLTSTFVHMYKYKRYCVIHKT